MLDILMKQMGINPTVIKQQFEMMQTEYRALCTVIREMQADIKESRSFNFEHGAQLQRIETAVNAIQLPLEGSTYDEMLPSGTVFLSAHKEG